ncbi:MAG: GumC family protein, partial [Candidatus Poribacteria bacterium]
MENTKNIPDSEKHLSDYLLILDRHKWIIIIAVVITISATIFFQKMQVPVYQTQVSIIIEEPNRVQSMIIPRSVDSPHFDYSLYLDTQIEIIKTTPILASVVKQLALSSSPEGTQEFSDVVDILRENIKINPVKSTKIVKIIVKYNDPEKAQNIANTVAQTYINQDTLSRLQTGQDSVRLLSAQLPDLKMKLKNSEDAFQLFKEKEGIIALDTKQGENLGEMTKLNANYLSARANRMEIEAIIDNFKTGKDATPNIPVGLLDNPILQKLGSELSQLYTDLEEKRRHFKDTYPGVIELKYRIKLAGQKIIEELNRQRDFLRTQEDSFLEQQKAKKQETVNLSKKEQEYTTLEREVMTNREMYNALFAKAKELSLAKGVDLSNIRVVELAEMPTVPLDRRRKIFALGGAFGLFLGVGLAFLFEYLRNTINTPDDVSLYLGLPVLGFVPSVAIAKHTKTPPIIIQNVNKNLEDMATEAYRTIRTNVLSSILVPPSNGRTELS